MADEFPTYASVTTEDGMTISTNSETADGMRANFGLTEPKANVDPGDVDDHPEPDAEPEPEPEKPVVAKTTDATPKEPEKPKLDGRTREGRKAAIQAEIDTLTATKHTTKREIEQAQAELAALKRERETLAAPKPQAEPEKLPSGKRTLDETIKKPDLSRAILSEEEFFTAHPDATYGQYGRYAARYELASERAEQHEYSRQQQWKQRVETLKKATPDWDARFKPETPIDRRLMPYLTSQEQGPEVLLYLSDHQDLAQRIATLHPIDQIGEIGKILARLDAAPPSTGPAPTPVASSAKPPIKPVTASPQVADGDDYSEDESVDKHIARENARERKAARR